MSDDKYQDEILKQKIRINEWQGMILECVSILFNILSFLVVVFAFYFFPKPLFLVLAFIGAVVIPVAGFAYAIIIHKKHFYYLGTFFIILFVINLIIYIIFLLSIALFAFVGYCFVPL